MGGGQHSAHAPDFLKCEREVCVGVAKQLAVDDPFCKTADIWDKATQNLSLDLQPFLPSENLFKDYIRRYKKSAYQFKDPKILMDLVVPNSFKFTFRGDHFLQFDSNDSKRILIFCTAQNLKILSSCETWVLDGTFKSCPKLYKKNGQLYTLHGFFIQKNKAGKVIATASLPLIYALLRDKSKSTYEALFASIINMATKVGKQCNLRKHRRFINVNL